VRSGWQLLLDSEPRWRASALGALNEVETVDLRWPSGIRQTVREREGDQVLASDGASTVITTTGSGVPISSRLPALACFLLSPYRPSV